MSDETAKEVIKQVLRFDDELGVYVVDLAMDTPLTETASAALAAWLKE